MFRHFETARAPRTRLRPISLAVQVACAVLGTGAILASASVRAQTAPVPAQAGVAADASAGKDALMPVVRVKAGEEATDPLITQGKAASVGKSGVSVQDTPFSLNVINVEQIRETGAKNIQDALLYSAGVYSGRYGFDTRGDWSAIRGMSPSAYLDGLRGIYGFYNNVRPELYTLERVEVLKGPASVLYGQADLGGIVNVVSKRPQKMAAKEIEVQIGSHSRKQVAADLTGPLNADATLLYRLVALKRDSDTQVDYVNDDALVLMPSLTWQPSADTSLTFQFVHQENDSKVSAQFLPSRGTLDPAPRGRIPTNRFVGEPGWDRYDTRKNELSMFLDQRLSSAWKVLASVRKTHSSSVTREHWTTVGAIPDAAGNITRTIHTADRKTDVLASDVRLEGDVPLGPTRHRVAAGLDYQDAFWEEYNYSSLATGGGIINVYDPVYGFVNTAALPFSDRPDNKIVQTGLYLMDHMEWGPWVGSAALRKDRARNEVLNVGTPNTVVRNSATTGRLGLMYRFGNGVSPYVSWSKAFVPNLGTDGTAATSYLKPTTGEQTEAGIKYLSNAGKTSAAFAWFDIKQKNRIVDGATPGGVEQVGARTKGWELEARHRVGAWELLGNYTELDAVNAVTGQRLSSVPKKNASGWVQYQFASGWRAGAGVRYVGDVTGNAGRPVVPSVSLIDVMVGYATGPWDFRFDVKNVADKEYVSWCRAFNQDCGYGDRLSAAFTARYRF